MGRKYLEQVFKDSTATGADRLVLLVIAHHANDAGPGLAWPSYRLIAQEAGVSRRQVYRSIQSLHDQGALWWSQKRYKDSKRQQNVYYLEAHQPGDLSCTLCSDRLSLNQNGGMVTGGHSFDGGMVTGGHKQSDRVSPKVGQAVTQGGPVPSQNGSGTEVEQNLTEHEPSALPESESKASAAEPPEQKEQNVAVVTGGHSFGSFDPKDPDSPPPDDVTFDDLLPKEGE
jgi:hypothetical protein